MQCKIEIIFLSISLNMFFGCSKEPSHWDCSFEIPQHMFWLRNKKINFQLRTLIWGHAAALVFILFLFLLKKKNQEYHGASTVWIQKERNCIAVKDCPFKIVEKLYNILWPCVCIRQGAQWLSGSVLDSRLRGGGFQPHRHHCVVVFEQDTFILA